MAWYGSNTEKKTVAHHIINQIRKKRTERIAINIGEIDEYFTAFVGVENCIDK